MRLCLGCNSEDENTVKEQLKEDEGYNINLMK
jgi:hypothetical protein